MRIVKATAATLPALCELALKLWPEHTREEMHADLEALTALPDAAFFLAMQDDAAVGFSQCQLRRDYVEGTSTTPVGYLEGIFVEEPFRRRGHRPGTSFRLRKLGPHRWLQGICQ